MREAGTVPDGLVPERLLREAGTVPDGLGGDGEGGVKEDCSISANSTSLRAHTGGFFGIMFASRESATSAKGMNPMRWKAICAAK